MQLPTSFKHALFLPKPVNVQALIETLERSMNAAASATRRLT
jgi:FixJ family two-component response regulator